MTAQFNLIEALFWMACGGVVYFRSRYFTGAQRFAANLAVPSFVMFSASDLIEMKTGAWWNPPALMYFKGLCIFFLVTAGICWYWEKMVSRFRKKSD